MNKLSQKIPIKIKLPVEELSLGTKRASLLINDKNQSIKFLFKKKNILLISSNTQGLGEAEIEIKIEYNMDYFEIAYNPIFLLEFLKSIDSKEVILELSTQTSPGILRPQDKETNYIYDIMPMRI